MDGFGRKGERLDITQMKGDTEKAFSPQALAKYDKMLGDDRLESGMKEDSPELSPGEMKEKYDRLFGEEGADPDDKSAYITENAGESRENIHDGLTDQERIKVLEETGWSDKIIDSMGSLAEYEIYKNAGLEEKEIGENGGLIRTDIDWNKEWETGKYDENGNPVYETNEDRIKKGRAPLDMDGKPIELHHIGQRIDSPLAELTFEEHRCNGNDTILHDKTIETQAHGEGNNWDNERQDYWKSRAVYNEGEYNNG